MSAFCADNLFLLAELSRRRAATNKRLFAGASEADAFRRDDACGADDCFFWPRLYRLTTYCRLDDDGRNQSRHISAM